MIHATFCGEPIVIYQLRLNSYLSNHALAVEAEIEFPDEKSKEFTPISKNLDHDQLLQSKDLDPEREFFADTNNFGLIIEALHNAGWIVLTDTWMKSGLVNYYVAEINYDNAIIQGENPITPLEAPDPYS